MYSSNSTVNCIAGFCINKYHGFFLYLLLSKERTYPNIRKSDCSIYDVSWLKMAKTSFFENKIDHLFIKFYRSNSALFSCWSVMWLKLSLVRFLVIGVVTNVFPSFSPFLSRQHQWFTYKIIFVSEPIDLNPVSIAVFWSGMTVFYPVELRFFLIAKFLSAIEPLSKYFGVYCVCPASWVFILFISIINIVCRLWSYPPSIF